MSETKYIVMRYYYRTAKDLEAGIFYRQSVLGFEPADHRTALILKSKCMEYPNSILRVVLCRSCNASKGASYD